MISSFTTGVCVENDWLPPRLKVDPARTAPMRFVAVWSVWFAASRKLTCTDTFCASSVSEGLFEHDAVADGAACTEAIRPL